MPPAGISAQGTIIRVSHDPFWPPSTPVGGALAFVAIAELREITPPALTRNEIEMTTHNEQDDSYIVGIRRHGTMTWNVNFLPNADLPGGNTHDHLTGLQKKWFDGTRNIYEIEYPDGTSWMFSGFVSNFAPSAPVDDRLGADVSVRPTGGHIWNEPA